jgi:anti-anti-sigma factor
MEVNLVVVEGKPLGAVIPLRAKRFVIGRDPSCQLRPKSPTVSLHHCVLTRRNDHVTVSDLGSTNGTLVNDRCLHRGEEVRVCDGDRLQVGQLIFAVRIASEVQAGTPGVEDWLLNSDPDPPDDPMARTMLVSSPVARPTALIGAGGGGRSQGQDPATAAQFSYRKVDPTRKVTVLGLSSEQLTDETAFRATRKALRALASRQQSRRLVLDLGALEALPSGACALLLALAEGCRAAGGELRIGGAAHEVRQMLAALKLDTRIECYDDAALALAEAWG